MMLPAASSGKYMTWRCLPLFYVLPLSDLLETPPQDDIFG